MCANYLLSLLLLSIAGAAFSASIKGATNGTKGRWDPPKDWDWSVTPGRLIPVSEATDDLPTPGYRMSQLQQRIPPHHDHQPFPIMEVAGTNNTEEEKVVLIGQNQPPVEVNEAKVVDNGLSTTQRLETTEHFAQSTPKQMKPQSALAEQELILLHDDPVVYQRESALFETSSTTEKREKVPVTEEVMEKVELPEICSISGIGCRDPKPVPQEPDVQTTPEIEEHTEVLKHPKVVPHPHVVSHKSEEEGATTEQSTEQGMTASPTVRHVAIEEPTTSHDQLPSDSHHIDQQVIQQPLPIKPSFDQSTDTTVDESLGSNSSIPQPSNETNSSQETLIVPHVNFTAPTVVHSVLTSVSEHVGFSNNSKQTDLTVMKNDTNVQSADPQYLVDESQIQFQQQEQQVQELGQPSQEAEVHQVDEQKLTEIANSWGSSSDNNSTSHSSERRMDEAEQEGKSGGATEVPTREDLPTQEAVSTGVEFKEVTHPTEQKNSTEPPTIGDRLESYWKAATGYVSKALNL